MLIPNMDTLIFFALFLNKSENLYRLQSISSLAAAIPGSIAVLAVFYPWGKWLGNQVFSFYFLICFPQYSDICFEIGETECHKRSVKG